MKSISEQFTFLYTEPGFTSFASMSDDRLAGFTERHKIELPPVALQRTRDLFAELIGSKAEGLVIRILSGWCSLSCLRLARKVLRSGRKVWFYWADEQAIECIDREHLGSYWRLWLFTHVDKYLVPRFKNTNQAAKPMSAGQSLAGLSGRDLARQVKSEIETCMAAAEPIPIAAVKPGEGAYTVPGTGVYLRMDFWAPAESGPDSCDTPRQVKALSGVAERMVCMLPHRFSLLDEMSLPQVVFPSPGASLSEDDLLRANAHYYPILRTALEALRPAFIFERLCADNFCGARLSHEFRIPYVVEYNGSHRSGYRFTELYSLNEELSFRQATAISVTSDALKKDLIQRGIASEKIFVNPDGVDGKTFLPVEAERKTIETGDAYKDQIQNQWDNNPCGSQYVKQADAHTLEWYLEVQRHRHQEYGPWMPEVMEFSRHSGKQLLEIGGGLGTDLSQFTVNGAHVTDLDLSSGHLALAQENFRLRGLAGRFIHHDAEDLPFGDNTFDVVYSNGVIHHTPNTSRVVSEMYRVLKPGGRIIVMVYAENSWHYWIQLVRGFGLKRNMLNQHSMGEIMSRSVEMTANAARPLVKVYTRDRLRKLFTGFDGIEIVQRQLTPPEVPRLLRRIPIHILERWMGWNLVIKANKPMEDANTRASAGEPLRRSA